MLGSIGAPEPTLVVGSVLFWNRDVSMFVLYLDEFGHPGPFDASDSRHYHHSLFGFTGIAIEGLDWRDLDRSFLRLKAAYYRCEIQRDQTLHGIRPERWEPKQLRRIACLMRTSP